MKRGFTLIELLVVISIIGLLSSIVLASLNSARVKGREASIKSNLRNMVSQTELSYDSITPNSYSTACASVSGQLTAIGGLNATSACWSYDNTRWGAAAKLNTADFKAWGVSSAGVVSWDAQGVDASGTPVGSDLAMPWQTAVDACTTAGGRLPSFEELKALSLAYGSALPPGFQVNSWYWSGTTYLIIPTVAHNVYLSNGNVTAGAKGSSYYVRCVH